MSNLPMRPVLPKRFYKEVTVVEEEGAHAIRLDGRAVRTPARAVLRLPSRQFAGVLAREWAAQVDEIDPATMPATRLANTVIDGVEPNPTPVRDDLVRYAETDLLAYRAADPERLVARQRERWDPLVRWVETETGSRFATGEGVMYVAQAPEFVVALRERIAGEADAFRLAALHQITTLTGSLILALAVAAGRLADEEAWALAHLDEDWNIELWGEDEDAAARRTNRFADMRAAALLLAGSD